MLTINKKVIVYRKADASEFSKKNFKVLPVGSNKIGSSSNAIKAILLRSDMLGDIMPGVLGVSKNQVDFLKKTSDYWNSIAVNVPETGKSLEIGFYYNLNDSNKVKNIKALKGADDKPKVFTTDQQLADYVENHVDENDQWMYGNPINAADYLLWRYCLNYRAVANSPDELTIGKSSDIRFYIHNEAHIKKVEAERFDIKSKAGKIYFDILADDKKVKNFLFALGKGAGISSMDALGRAKLLEMVYLNTPNLMLDANSDKQLNMKAYVEECIISGVLRRLPNTTTIVNSTDNVSIGNNIDDAIVFLTADSNAKIANEIQGRLKALPTKN